MRIYITSVFVDDQTKALEFYTDRLGFLKKNDIPLGEYRWLSVVGKGEPEGTELLLEPAVHRAVAPYREALVADGIPAASLIRRAYCRRGELVDVAEVRKTRQRFAGVSPGIGV